MPYPLAKLIENREPPLSVQRSETIREALTKMIANDYSQLVVRDAEGAFVGIISEQTIIRQLFHLDKGYQLFLDLTVDHAESRAEQIPIDSDVFDVLQMLIHTYAVIVTENRDAVGIITHADTTDFFRQRSEGMIYIENIETTLRGHIKRAFPDPKERARAIRAAIPPPPKQTDRPTPDVEGLTLSEEINVIRCRQNWEHFEEVMLPKDVFSKTLEPINKIRNQVFHFRGDPNATQRDALLNANRWLDRRPIPKQNISRPQEPDDVIESAARFQEHEPYAAALHWLLWLGDELTTPSVGISLDDLEQKLGEEFPDSVRQNASFWSSDLVLNPRSITWLAAGWADASLEVPTQSLLLSRAVQLTLFPVERDRIRDPVSIIPFDLIRFPLGKSRCYFEWSLGREDLYIGLQIGTGNTALNRQITNGIQLNWATIEQRLGHSIVIEGIADGRDADEPTAGEPVGDQAVDEEPPYGDEYDEEFMEDEEEEEDAAAYRVYARMPIPARGPSEDLRAWALSVRPWAIVRLLRFVDVCKSLIEESSG